MSRNQMLLLFLLVFNSLSAIGGGIALMHGSIKQPVWVHHTDFKSLYFPGVILLTLVGGSALLAALAMLRKISGWQLACIASGVIMLFWIIGEIVSIRQFHWLQAIYLVTGIVVIYLTPAGELSGKRKI